MEKEALISWFDFEKIDVRAGTITEASEYPEAKKPAYKLLIDFGALGIKRSSAQITAHYKPQDLVGKQILAVVNFPEKQIGKFVSQCLVLGLYESDGSVILIQPERKVPDGSKLG